MDNRLELIKNLLKRQQELRADLTAMDNDPSYGDHFELDEYELENELDNVDDRIAELKGEL